MPRVTRCCRDYLSPPLVCVDSLAAAVRPVRRPGPVHDVESSNVAVERAGIDAELTCCAAVSLAGDQLKEFLGAQATQGAATHLWPRGYPGPSEGTAEGAL